MAHRQPAPIFNPVWVARRVWDLGRTKGAVGAAVHLGGIAAVLSANASDAVLRPVRVTYARRYWKDRTFSLAGRTYPYFYHGYNDTWSNERCVELAVARSFVAKHAGSRILEAGNVLSHYMRFAHDIVDKYEPGPGVLNVDLVDFQPAEPYDLIVSISTIEHIGWEEKPREPEKAVRALHHLRTLLSSAGELLVTFPIGYNTHLDGLVQSQAIPLDDVRLLRRVTADNQWVEASLTDASRASYGVPYRSGNVVVIATSGR